MSTHGNPPRRPPTAGGSASRPTAPPAGGRPAPAGRPAPVRPAAPPRPAAPAPEELEDDAKTQAFNIADMGLDDDDEKTAAFNIDDLPLDDAPPARQPQRTLVGHPVSPKAARPAPTRSAPVRSAPVRSGSAAPAAPAEATPDEATQAMDMSAMLAAVDDDGDEKTAAISLDEIQAMNAVAARPRGKAAEAADLIGANDKTLAMQLDKPIEELAAPSAPPKAAAAKVGKAANAASTEVPSADGLMGSIAYFFQSGAIRARVERGELPKSAYDEAAAKKGLVNTAIIGGGVLALTLVAGLLV